MSGRGRVKQLLIRERARMMSGRGRVKQFLARERG